MTMSLEEQIAILQAQQERLALEWQALTSSADSKWYPMKDGAGCNFSLNRYRISQQPINRIIWINCCHENLYLFGSKQEAEIAATHTRIALRKIHLSFFPGQFDKE